MSAERQYGLPALAAVLVAHVAQCGLPLRSDPPDTVDGERVYKLICPRCGQYVASVVLETPRRHA